MNRLIALTCCVFLVAFTGCTRNGDNGDPLTQPTEEATATPQPTPCVLEQGSTRTEETTSEQPTSLLTDVRPNTEGCPRVVFEFDDHVPGYKVSYIDPPIRDCGSGDEQPIDQWGSDAYLSVRMEPASSADLSTEEVEPTYTGPRDFPFDDDVLRRLVKTCDFEAVLEWVIALDEERDFNVMTFEKPARLVIDVSEG